MPDLPKLRVWGSNLSDDKFQFSVLIDKDQYFQLCSPIPPQDVVFPLSEHFWSTEAQIGYLLLAHPHLLRKTEKTKSNVKAKFWNQIVNIYQNFI